MKDVATVTPSGASLDRVIDGVLTFTPPTHVDHRGRLFEVYPGTNEFWEDPLVYCYAWTIRAGMVKGWGLHLDKCDRYTLIQGEIITVLCDARSESPTHGLVQQVTLSGQGIRQLKIPAGIWHMNVNVGDSEAFLVNHPSETYHHEAPDRFLLPWDTDQIPFDLAKLFPVQGSVSGPCGA